MDYSLFKPKASYYEVGYYLNGGSNYVILDNDQLYGLVEKLVSALYPDYSDEYDEKWFSLYLPLRRSGRLITIPFSIVKYQNRYYMGIRNYCELSIGRGNAEADDFYKKILEDALLFLMLIKGRGEQIINKTVPYDIRIGKVLGKQVMKNVLPQKEAKKIMTEYRTATAGNREINGISLNEYLNVASLCYKAAYGKKVAGLSDEEMYKKYADSRDGGMLAITDRNSREAFTDWYGKGRCIGHPFEIVFSWHSHGIHLYPPDTNENRFVLRVTNKAHVDTYLSMVKALTRNNIIFKAVDLEDILHYCSGETFINVNSGALDGFIYSPSRENKKKYFQFIEWEKLSAPRFR